METKKFEALESQKKELEKEFKVPVFIDIKEEKLYIINDEWFNQYVF